MDASVPGKELTAAERRRVQNREAQRRFRQRKRVAEKTLQNQCSDADPDHVDTAAAGPGPARGLFAAPSCGLTACTVTVATAGETAMTSTRTDSLPPTSTPPGFGFGRDCFMRGIQSYAKQASLSLGSDEEARPDLLSQPVSGQPLPPDQEDEPRATVTAPSSWRSPLHLAAQRGNNRIVGALLQQNETGCNELDGDGLTPLMYAAAAGWSDVVATLLAHGAQVELVDEHHGRSALHWAVLFKRDIVLKMLLDHVAGGGGQHQHEEERGKRAQPTSLLDAYDKDGQTPLHLAVAGDFETGVQLLLQAGADVTGKPRAKPA